MSHHPVSRLTWVVPAHRYRDAPEPQLPGHSVTIRPSADMVAQQLHEQAPRYWNPTLARLMQATEARPSACLRPRGISGHHQLLVWCWQEM